MIFDLEKIIQTVECDQGLSKIVRPKLLTNIKFKTNEYPIYSFTLGTTDKKAPTLFLTGGVHGLERIGAQLAWSLLKTTVDKLKWDNSLIEMFAKIRLVVVPLVNPSGFYHKMRSNGNGVDLMRNSPVRSSEKVPFLVGGQSYSNRLPWYHGNEHQLETENQILYDLFADEALKSKYVIGLDCHSGFGLRDRLWFPYSHKREPFENLPEMFALSELLNQAHPYHIYQIEPQTAGYLLNGDIWDHLYLKFLNNSEGVFLPLTLEMGSWSWVKKNPLQLFSKQGPFNPIKEHRIKRTFRRHHLLFEFLLKALYSSERWAVLNSEERHKSLLKAKELWY